MESLKLEKFKKIENMDQVNGGGIFPKKYSVSTGESTGLEGESRQHYIKKQSGWFDWNKKDDTVVKNSGYDTADS